MEHLEGEVIVVDNASVDGTAALVRQHFPNVQLIANTENAGFAKANNQGIRIAKGEYILLLNPDTIVSGDTFIKCIRCMDEHPDAGAIGVKMIDGSGQFLPESKRGLPTLQASFMKMSGLYKLFPRSAKLNAYYMGHIGENETAPIEVLCGAFMFMRRKALEKSGYLDEDFFMYGEDIDLSYRIRQSGYAIYYFPETQIIHYKGESTKKSSLNYILTFYQAMLIFTQKHPEFSGQKRLIQVAIYFHGAWQYMRQNISRWWPMLLDFILAGSLYFLVSRLWAQYYFNDPAYYKPNFYSVNLPLYTLMMILGLYFNGAYDKPYTKRTSWLGFLSGVLLILVIYAVMPAELRASRMVILLGSLLFAGWLTISRAKFSPWNLEFRHSDQQAGRRAIILAGEEEASRIKELINRSRDHIQIVGTVDPGSTATRSLQNSLGTLSQLEDIVRVYQIKEVIFSAQDVPFSVLTGSMTRLGPNLRYMLAASTTMNIVGSMRKDTEGESYAIRIHFQITEPQARRTKRLFDFVSSLLFLSLFPVLIFFIPHPLAALKNILHVLIGRKTWVSYHPMDPEIESLPRLPEGILHPAYPIDENDVARRLRHIHYVYARDYHWATDLSILLTQLKKTGQTHTGYEQ